jgi:hypothetical protein
VPKTSCTCEKCQGKTVDSVTWGEYVLRLSEPSNRRARSAFYDMITQAVNNRTRGTTWWETRRSELAVDWYASPCEDESEPQGG